MHRGTDGLVPLCRRVDGQWQELGSIPAADLCGLFADETFAELTSVDGYFGLHAMYRPGRCRTERTLPNLRPALRNVESVRYLTCCHVDLDGYKHGLDSHGVVAAVMRLVDAGTLPPPSVFTLSRGVWALWRLRDRVNVGEPLRAYPESVMSRWCRVQGALTRVCSAIGSDAAATHAATVTRIPGSVNSKNGLRVGYMLPANVHGEPFAYTLDDLEAFMRPHLPVARAPRPAGTKSNNPALSARGLKGWHGRWRRLLRALGHLRDLRGGWKLGTRNTALFYAAMALRALGARSEEVQAVMADHLAWMDQPIGEKLRMSDAMRIHRSLRRLRGPGVSLQTVADALHVSPSEAALLSESRKRPFPPASRAGSIRLPKPPAVPKAVATARRRDTVKAICETLRANGIVPDGAVVQDHLLAQGIKATRPTVLADMLEIGCPSSRSHNLRRTAHRGESGKQANLFQCPDRLPTADASPQNSDFKLEACRGGAALASPPVPPRRFTPGAPPIQGDDRLDPNGDGRRSEAHHRLTPRRGPACQPTATAATPQSPADESA